MALGRWEAFLESVEARQGTLLDTRQQHWQVMQRCCLDMAACAQLSEHDELRTRAHLYRSYQALVQGYVAVHQAVRMDTMERVVQELRQRGILPEDFTL